MKKALKLCGLTACCAVMLSSYTCAYIDPSVMTYTIQAIAGVVIAVGAVVGIYWRKAKKKVNEKLGLDENRHKEVESDVLEIKEDDVEPNINVTSSVTLKNYDLLKSGQMDLFSHARRRKAPAVPEQTGMLPQAAPDEGSTLDD